MAATWLGGGGYASVDSIAVDNTSNVYLGGFFQSADLTTNLTSPPTLTLLGGQDAFAIKLDSSGTTLWAKNFGGTGGANAAGYSIAVDSTGNVYLGGNFNNADITNVTPALTKIGQSDAFVLKLDSDGTTTWAKNFGGSGAGAYGYGIAVDAAGYVYLGGIFTNGHITNLTPLPALTKIGDQDAFALKLNFLGTTIWAKNFGGLNARVTGQSIAADSTGNVYLGGYFENADITNVIPALTRLGSTDAFAIKLDSNGAVTPSGWAKTFGGPGARAYAQSIAVDNAGNVYLGGNFDSASLLTPALTQIGIEDAFVIKLDSLGDSTWWQKYGGSGARASGSSIAQDSSGNVYLGGYYQQASLTTPALPLIANQHGFVLKRATVAAVNGACGSAHATTPLVTSAPSTNLCTAGTAGSVTSGASAYTWSCTGTGSGSTASCSASRGYTVTFDANTGTGTMAAQSANYNVATALTSNAFTKTGYTFAGWNTAAGGGGNPYANSASYGFAASTTLYAQWTITAVNGTCATVAATAFVPTTGLCTQGTAPSSATTGSPWTWSCTGSGGGTTASCSAPNAATATGTGTGRASISGGNWVVDAANSGFVATSTVPSLPPGTTFPHGLLNLKLTTGVAGTSATVLITYPSALPAGTVYWKYGRTASNTSAHWYQFAGAAISGSTITLTLTDGADGDDDMTANSVITDPGGPGLPDASAAASIPTLSEWGMIILAGLMALFGWIQLRRRPALY